MHEWFMVSQAPKFKSWGMKAEDIMSAVTKTTEIKFYNIKTKNGIGDGVHGIETASVSSMAHKEMEKLIKESNSKEEYMSKLTSWADKHFGRKIDKDTIIMGSDGLPEYFKKNNKKEIPKKCAGK